MLSLGSDPPGAGKRRKNTASAWDCSLYGSDKRFVSLWESEQTAVWRDALPPGPFVKKVIWKGFPHILHSPWFISPWRWMVLNQQVDQNHKAEMIIVSSALRLTAVVQWDAASLQDQTHTFNQKADKAVSHCSPAYWICFCTPAPLRGSNQLTGLWEEWTYPRVLRTAFVWMIWAQRRSHVPL